MGAQKNALFKQKHEFVRSLDLQLKMLFEIK